MSRKSPESSEPNHPRTPGATRYRKGVSGNPAGRPLGSRNKSTLLLESLLENEGEGLIRKTIELAQKGEMQALRLCLERIYPPRRERLIELPLSEFTEPHQVATVTASILTAVAQGKITPGEAESLSRTVKIHTQVLETQDFAHRIAQLEKSLLTSSTKNQTGYDASGLYREEQPEETEAEKDTETGARQNRIAEPGANSSERAGGCLTLEPDLERTEQGSSRFGNWRDGTDG